MDLFEHRYYRLSKKFMMLLGQWPDQSTRAKRGFLAVSIFILITGWVPAILAHVKNYGDRRIVLDCILVHLIAAISFVKIIGIMWNSDKILMLLNRTCTNWQVWARHREINILHKYAKQGEQMIIVYTAAMYSTVIISTAQPIILKIIDVISKNATEPAQFPYPVEYYYFDAQKYYCYVITHCHICACICAIPLIASDGMLIIYVQHVCGVFAALRHKSKEIGRHDRSMENVIQLSSLIERHNDSIEYANLIEATYTWMNFFMIGLAMIMINLLGLQILVKANDPELIIRFIVTLLALGLIFFIDCYICQTLIDHSSDVGVYIYNSQWYRLLASDRKLLQLIIMRCRIPCQVTAGKMLIMSIRNFGLTCKAAMSYFAVIRSVDGTLNNA